MIWLWAGVAGAADCAGPVPVHDLSELLDAAEQGYAALDVDTFTDRLDQAALALPCLNAVVPPSVAARYHGLVGLRLFTSGQEEQAAAAFASARVADPGFRFRGDVLPAGHEVLALLEGAVPGGTEPVPPPAEVRLFFDGTEGDERPVERPVIVQLVGHGGEVEATAWAGTGDALPPYELEVVAPEPQPVVTVVPAPMPEPLPAPRERRPRWVLLGAAGAAGVASAVLYGTGAASQAKFQGPLPPEVGREELLALRGRTNALVIGSGVAGGLAAAGAVAFVVVR